MGRDGARYGGTQGQDGAGYGGCRVGYEGQGDRKEQGIWGCIGAHFGVLRAEWTGVQGNRIQWGMGCAHVGDEGHGVLLMRLRVVMVRCSKAMMMGGCPQWPGAKTACGTWTKTGHGTLASTASSSPSAAARASSGTAARTLCACSPSASSATAWPSGATARADGAGGSPGQAGCWHWVLVMGSCTGCWSLCAMHWALVLGAGQWYLGPCSEYWALGAGCWC